MSMRTTRLTACFVVFIGMVCSADRASSFDIVLNNLDQSNGGDTFSASVGQSFLTGSVAESLTSVVLRLDAANTSLSGLQLLLESRASDGTIGSALFSGFNSSFDASTGLATFTTSSPYTLAANTGYWLVASDSGSQDKNIYWAFTSSQTYTSAVGYTLPSSDCSYLSGQAGNMSATPSYFSLADGPQLFQLTTGTAAPAVPEPTSLVLCGIAGLIGLACHRSGWNANPRRMLRRNKAN